MRCDLWISFNFCDNFLIYYHQAIFLLTLIYAQQNKELLNWQLGSRRLQLYVTSSHLCNVTDKGDYVDRILQHTSSLSTWQTSHCRISNKALRMPRLFLKKKVQLGHTNLTTHPHSSMPRLSLEYNPPQLSHKLNRI